MKKISYVLILLLAVYLSITAHSYASTYKVLAVMSYDHEYAWVQEIKQGIETVLDNNFNIKYFYMDTKKNLAGGSEKAKQVYELYKEFHPDGVIAADDNAQSMFVVPYLKNRVKTPVIFCGINEAPEEYGYPASNVTGILERLHIRSSIAFAQQLIPSIKTIAYMSKENPSARAVFKQFKSEINTYPAEFVDFKMVKTFDEALSFVNKLKNQADALFFATMEGIQDDKGRMFNDREVIPILSKAFGKPIISNNLYHVEYGTLCAVIKTGQEQGKTAAEMLIKALNGTPVSQIPITSNREGKRVINLGVMKALGINPPSETLKNTQLVGIEKSTK